MVFDDFFPYPRKIAHSPRVLTLVLALVCPYLCPEGFFSHVFGLSYLTSIPYFYLEL